MAKLDIIFDLHKKISLFFHQKHLIKNFHQYLQIQKKYSTFASPYY